MPKEILVVDDQPGIRLLLTDILTSEGHQVTLASTGKEALDKIHQASFDLIILDYKLPIIDGKEVLNQLENEKVKTPVIVMSGMAESISGEMETRRIVRCTIAKPFNVMDLCTNVRNIFITH
ncbi:response regulator [Oceanobacillus sp. FSL K6-2867]|uniref:response regulator n=1 Tax=Oceanobacillus sp. FSL K6-2867 TaxID=2954748 RepID=UPI0030D7AD1C